ncbi:MAG: HD domain-containing protein [Burkholderiaceae bacterium]
MIKTEDGLAARTDGGEKIKCTHLKDLTRGDIDIITRHLKPYVDTLADRVLAHLKSLEADEGGFPVTRLEHNVQCASRALRDGKDEEYVVAALVHDIGDRLCTYNHPEMAAAILQPFVRPELHWMVLNHEVFQGYYFFHLFDKDKEMRQKFKDHPCYDMTVEFCAKYDAPAFDPDYKSIPLEEFVPMVRRVFARPRDYIYGDRFAGM